MIAKARRQKFVEQPNIFECNPKSRLPFFSTYLKFFNNYSMLVKQELDNVLMLTQRATDRSSKTGKQIEKDYQDEMEKLKLLRDPLNQMQEVNEQGADDQG